MCAWWLQSRHQRSESGIRPWIHPCHRWEVRESPGQRPLGQLKEEDNSQCVEDLIYLGKSRDWNIRSLKYHRRKRDLSSRSQRIDLNQSGALHHLVDFRWIFLKIVFHLKSLTKEKLSDGILYRSHMAHSDQQLSAQAPGYALQHGKGLHRIKLSKIMLIVISNYNKCRQPRGLCYSFRWYCYKTLSPWENGCRSGPMSTCFGRWTG